MNDTPTPRTDAVQFFVSTTTKQSPDEGGMFVEVDFARQLERELAECQRRLNEFEHPRDPIDPTDPPEGKSTITP